MSGIYARSYSRTGLFVWYAPVGPSAGIRPGKFVQYARRPPGAKCPVFTPVVIAAWGYVFGMLVLRIIVGEVSGGRVPIDI